MTIHERVERLRRELGKDGLAGFLVPRADEHQGEYVPPRAQRLAWLTGFTGSAGLAVVLADAAAIFVDGRYTLQVRDETPGDVFEYHHVTESPPAEWLRLHLRSGRPARLRPVAPHDRERGAAPGRVRQGRRHAGPRRREPRGPDLGRPAAAAARSDRPPRPEARRPALPGQAARDRRAPRARRRRRGGPRRSRLDRVAPQRPRAATSPTRRCRSPSRWCTATRPWTSSWIRPSSRQASGSTSARACACCRRTRSAPRLDRLGAARRTVQVDPSSTAAWIIQRLTAAGATVARGGRPVPPPQGHEERRGAGRGPQRPREGRHRAHPLLRLARPRGARGPPHGDHARPSAWTRCARRSRSSAT